MKHFILSSLIFFTVQLPTIISSFLVVPLLLLTKWDGTTTIYGNYKYGRGTTHYKAPTNNVYWREVLFLCLRNPVSNFGKTFLSVKTAPWVWLHDTKILGNFYWKYGWKDEVKETPNIRTFVYRPWFHK